MAFASTHTAAAAGCAPHCSVRVTRVSDPAPRKFAPSACARSAAAMAAASEPSARKKVVVVGAGIAGVACARQLREHGVDVLVLEASERIGGRIHTAHWEGVPTDLGASWIHGVKGNPIAGLADELGVDTVVSNLYNCGAFDGGKQLGCLSKLVQLWRYGRLAGKLRRLGCGLGDDVSVEDGLKEVIGSEGGRGWAKSKFASMMLYLDTADNYATEASVLSLKEWKTDEDFDGHDAVFPNGYAEVVEKCAEGVSIRLNQRVEAIEWGGTGVVTVFSGEESFSCDAVVITVSLGVLQSKSIAFRPPLPSEKANSIKRLHMGCFNKIILKFSHVFWPNRDCFAFLTSMHEDQIRLIINFDKYSKVPVLMGLLGGRLAKDSEMMTDEQLVNLMMSRLKEAFGKNIPNPVAVCRTKWSKNPFFLGAYSSIPVGSSVQDRANLGKSVSGRLFWAGEATSLKYPSTVHGAFLAGDQVAGDVLDSMNIIK